MSKDDPGFVDPGVVEPGGVDPEAIADEQFVHGLLESERRDDDQARRQRMARVVAGIGGDASHLASPRARWWRRAAVPITMAAALAVVATFLMTVDRRSAADVVASLRWSEVGPAKVGVTAISSAAIPSAAKVYGVLDLGDSEARLLGLKVMPKKAGCLLLRTDGGDCLVRSSKKTKLPVRLAGWPQWLRTDQLVVPLSTPAEWLAALLQSHSFTFEGQGQKQRVLGRRQATITDPLVPARCELVLDEGRRQLLSLRLFWAPVAAAPKRRSLEQALGYFDSLDEDRDGEVTREEAREGWGRFSEMGFGEEQVVTRRGFQDAMAPRFAADALEFLSRRPDLEVSQPPQELILKLQPVGDRPTWLFEAAVFRRR